MCLCPRGWGIPLESGKKKGYLVSVRRGCGTRRGEGETSAPFGRCCLERGASVSTATGSGKDMMRENCGVGASSRERRGRREQLLMLETERPVHGPVALGAASCQISYLKFLLILTAAEV